MSYVALTDVDIDVKVWILKIDMQWIIIIFFFKEKCQVPVCDCLNGVEEFRLPNRCKGCRCL